MIAPWRYYLPSVPPWAAALTCDGHLVLQLHYHSAWQELTGEVEQVRVVEHDEELCQLSFDVRHSCHGEVGLHHWVWALILGGRQLDAKLLSNSQKSWQDRRGLLPLLPSGSSYLNQLCLKVTSLGQTSNCFEWFNVICGWCDHSGWPGPAGSLPSNLTPVSPTFTVNGQTKSGCLRQRSHHQITCRCRVLTRG